MARDPMIVALEANTKALIANTKAVASYNLAVGHMTKALAAVNANLVIMAKTAKEEDVYDGGGV